MGDQSVWHASSLPGSHYMGRLGDQVWYKCWRGGMGHGAARWERMVREVSVGDWGPGGGHLSSGSLWSHCNIGSGLIATRQSGVVTNTENLAVSPHRTKNS